MNILTLGIYSNGDYAYNVVREEDLENHIQYNLAWRPGRILYVDGKRMNTGCIKEEYLGKYDKIAEEFFKNKEHINMNNATLPYR